MTQSHHKGELVPAAASMLLGGTEAPVGQPEIGEKGWTILGRDPREAVHHWALGVQSPHYLVKLSESNGSCFTYDFQNSW